MQANGARAAKLIAMVMFSALTQTINSNIEERITRRSNGEVRVDVRNTNCRSRSVVMLRLMPSPRHSLAFELVKWLRSRPQRAKEHAQRQD